MQSSSQIVTTNKPTQAGCPSCRPTNSVKALKGTLPLIHRQSHLTKCMSKCWNSQCVTYKWAQFAYTVFPYLGQLSFAVRVFWIVDSSLGCRYEVGRLVQDVVSSTEHVTRWDGRASRHRRRNTACRSHELLQTVRRVQCSRASVFAVALLTKTTRSLFNSFQTTCIVTCTARISFRFFFFLLTVPAVTDIAPP